MGRYLCALILCLALAVPVGAEPVFSLATALEVAKEESMVIKMADLALEEARLAYEETKADYLLRSSIIAKTQGENQWRIAQRNRELAQGELAMEVETAYYRVLRSEMALDLAQRSLKQAQTQLASTQVRHEQGMLSDVDLLAAQSQVAVAELEVNRAQADYDTARMAFNRLLGRDLDAPFQLVDEFTYEPVEVHLEEAIEHALANRLELARARDVLKLREQELAVSDHEFTPPLTIAKARLALERAQLELAEREVDIRMEVSQNYHQLREAEARVPIQQKNLARAQESLRITEARYEVGVITSAELIDAQRAAFQGEVALIQAVFDYNTALARFYRSAGYPLVPDQDGE
ncbi:MAG: TolC family protein [Limnochordia bacterium]|jgi:outer membrane protein